MTTMADDPILWSAVVDAAALVLDGQVRGAKTKSLVELMPKVVDVKATGVNLEIHFADGSERTMVAFE